MKYYLPIKKKKKLTKNTKAGRNFRNLQRKKSDTEEHVVFYIIHMKL